MKDMVGKNCKTHREYQGYGGSPLEIGTHHQDPLKIWAPKNRGGVPKNRDFHVIPYVRP